MALWTPSNLDLAQVWLKGGAGITDDGGPGGQPPNVSQWANQIPDVTNGSTFFQTFVSAMPKISSTGIVNGIAGLDFSGNKQLPEFLAAGDVNTLDNLGTYMMAAVIRPTLGPETRAILSKGTGAADGSFSWRISNAKTGHKLIMSIFDADNQVGGNIVNAANMESDANEISNETDTICLTYRTPTTAQHRINGTDSGSAGGANFMGAVSGNVSNSAMVGEFQGGGCDPFDGLIFEIVVASASALSGNSFANLEDIDSVEGYLAHRYDLDSNLPDTHKYKEFSPASGLHGVHNQDLIGELALDVSGPLVSDTLAGAI